MTTFLRFGLFFLLFVRFPVVVAKLRRRFKGEVLFVGKEKAEYTVRRGKRRDVESVALGVRVADKVRFCIQPETGFDRFCKSIGLSEEWQTRDEAFDRDAFILCDDAILLQALRRNEVLRSAVSELVGKPNGGTLRCSQGCLWVELKSFADKKLDNDSIASDVAGRVLPALLRIREQLEGLASGEWRTDRDAGLSRESLLLILSLSLGALGGIALFFFHDPLNAPRQIVTDAINTVSIWTAAVGILAFVTAAILLLRASSRLHWVVLDILLVGAPGIYLVAYAVAIWQNQHFDSSAGTELLIEVPSGHVVTGRKGRRTYYIEVQAWPDARADKELKVRSELYYSLQEQRCLHVRWHRGAYGDPWVSEMTPARQGCR